MKVITKERKTGDKKRTGRGGFPEKNKNAPGEIELPQERV